METAPTKKPRSRALPYSEMNERIGAVLSPNYKPRHVVESMAKVIPIEAAR